ncbi:hypothetical protein BP5796_00191 [Coleophoma crateriformis]|uniref:Velvet domain-containing protein n=1 Tax=Coleophoma crateriformis TaxID=565419 RepID=A0A3D8T8U4_9HELO|nr:hypothetical protein BP5796_00191 [Coleophoma crateriformis]
MATVQSHHHHTQAAKFQIPELSGSHCSLKVVQQPVLARVSIGKDKDRKPCDPPPILELQVHEQLDPSRNYLQSPYFFVFAILIKPDGSPAEETTKVVSSGAATSSLHRLKNVKNEDGAYFVFGDLSIKLEGEFRLRFNLFEMQDGFARFMQAVDSDVFTVYGTKNFPGMGESTYMTRSFADQGVRLRLRKEPRQLQRRNGPRADAYVPKHYNKQAGKNKRKSSEGNMGEIREGMIELPTAKLERQSFSGGSDPSPTLRNQRQSSPAAPSSYEHRSSLDRGHTQLANPFAAYTNEPLAKRQRTVSAQDQQHDFSQTHTLQTQQYPANYPQQPDYDPYPGTQQTYQQQMYSTSYSMPATTSSNFTHLASRQDRSDSLPSGSYSPFYINSQRSASSGYLPSQSPTARSFEHGQPQYNMGEMTTTVPHRPMSGAQGSFGMERQPQYVTAPVPPLSSQRRESSLGHYGPDYQISGAMPMSSRRTSAMPGVFELGHNTAYNTSAMGPPAYGRMDAPDITQVNRAAYTPVSVVESPRPCLPPPQHQQHPQHVPSSYDFQMDSAHYSGA